MKKKRKEKKKVSTITFYGTLTNYTKSGSRKNATVVNGNVETHRQVDAAAHVNDIAYTDFNIYDGEQIPINEELDSINTRELNGNCYSLDENTLGKKPLYVRFRPEINIKDPKIFVGLFFNTKKLFKTAVEHYSVEWGKEYKWIKDEKKKIRANCKNEKLRMVHLCCKGAKL